MDNMNELNINELEEATGGARAGGTKNRPDPKAGYIVYQITASDNLTRIAKRFNTTVAAIMRANPSITDKNLIRTDYWLLIPQKK